MDGSGYNLPRCPWKRTARVMDFSEASAADPLLELVLPRFGPSSPLWVPLARKAPLQGCKVGIIHKQ